MGEFSFRSASAMNINLKPSVGSVQQTTSKLQAAAAAAAASTQPPPSRTKVNGLSTPRQIGVQTQRSPVKPGKYWTSVSLADSGAVPVVSAVPAYNHLDGHADRPQVSRHRPAAPAYIGSASDNKVSADMKGHSSPADDTYESFDPPPPLKFTPNGHTTPMGPVSPVSPGMEPARSPEPPALTNGVPKIPPPPPPKNGPSQPSIEPHRFHIRELPPAVQDPQPGQEGDEHPFFSTARDVKQPDTFKNELQIVSAKGTVRGFKNRVRAGIAVFRQQNDGVKNYRAAEKGLIVLYTTSMMIVRSTHEKCIRVKKILQTHMVQYVEKDIFMSRENQRELMMRLERTHVEVPQVFADGQHLGGAEELTGMNEDGELRKIFKHFKKVSTLSSCEKCGGYRYIPCTSCHGSKKSLHRNHFTAEFCALRCIICDENGLVKCDVCSNADVP